MYGDGRAGVGRRRRRPDLRRGGRKRSNNKQTSEPESKVSF